MASSKHSHLSKAHLQTPSHPYWRYTFNSEFWKDLIQSKDQCNTKLFPKKVSSSSGGKENMGKVKLKGKVKKSYVPWNQNFKLLQTSILMEEGLFFVLNL